MARCRMEAQMPDRSKDQVQVYEREDGKFDWHRKDLEGRVLDESTQGYENQADAVEAAHSLNTDLPTTAFVIGGH